MLDRMFQLTEFKTTTKREVLAGFTTFMTMAYILVVNPLILSSTGMDKGALITATALSAAIATLFMGFVAKLPFALAPGMGLNAFFAYTVVLGMGYSWEFALTAVFLEGILFLILTAFNIREAIINAIPLFLKKAVSVGIGLFIAFIGLVNSGVIKTGMKHVGEDKLSGIVVTLGDLSSGSAIVALLGIIFTTALLIKKVKGALLIGIGLATLIGIPLGVTVLGDNFAIVDAPPSLAPIFGKLSFSQVFSWDMAIVLFTFLFVDLFDTVGTLVGVCTKADMLDKEGRVPRVKQALFADAVGTTVGALLGTSTVTTYVESATGVAEGGRTGLTAVTTGVLFLLALFFAPLLSIIPAAATAPALVIVGLFMMTPIKEIDLEDYSQALPAFLTIIMMPLTYSIADGIVFGMLSFVFLNLILKKGKDLNWVMWILAVLFIGKLFF